MSCVAIVGAGPTGLFAADRLAEQGVDVVLINRDIKPGGLAEYGIYHEKIKVKEALRKQFRKILVNGDAAATAGARIEYYGNVTVGETGDLSLDDLRDMGFDAIMVTVGAQGTKWLGLPGEQLEGVYHAKEIIYHYNKLPPYSEREFAIGKHSVAAATVALIGVGNVMADIARWLVCDLNVAEVIAVARRGPAEVKFDKRELQYVGDNLDLEDLDREIARVAPRMRAVGQEPEEAKAFIVSCASVETQNLASLPHGKTRVRFRFLSAPKRLLDDGEGRVGALEIEDTELVLNDDGSTWPRRMQTLHRLNVDTVIFCIGDRVSESLGLPVVRNEFLKCPDPCYPVDGVCYEVYDPDAEAPMAGVFVAGWARQASTGQVGLARKDGRLCAEAVLQYIADVAEAGDIGQRPRPTEALRVRLEALDKPVVTKEDWQRLEEIEAREAERRGLETFKFETNEAMLHALDLIEH
jgi:ferredoxin--NADP+ reductase